MAPDVLPHLLRTTARWLLALSAAAASLCVVPCATEPIAVAQAAEPTAAEILQRADDVRNPAESYFLRVQVVSSDKPDEPSEFEVSLLGSTKTLISTIKPRRDRGRNMLMRDTQMWAYIPNLKRAVRVSLSQRLVGQAANGDISRMRWTGDYNAAIESQNDRHWTLFLTGNKQGLTYAKIRVIIEKGTFHPLFTEYLTLNGRVLKKAQFTDYRELCGRMRPSEIRIQDAVRESDKSVIKVLAMEVRQFPASLFSPDNLD
jgi:outer membrane lipoprotein-sorting protein